MDVQKRRKREVVQTYCSAQPVRVLGDDMGTEAFASFALNYVRRAFEIDDEGTRVAYFELLSDMYPRELLRTYRKRRRWARDNYIKFCEQLDVAEEG